MTKEELAVGDAFLVAKVRKNSRDLRIVKVSAESAFFVFGWMM
jgi:hypothetical protein